MLSYYLLSIFGLVCALSLEPVVNLGYGTFWGNDSLPNVHFFGGIPYAKPPTGDLRFRAPQNLDEHATEKVVFDARNWGPLCIQQPAVVGIGSEGSFVLDSKDGL